MGTLTALKNARLGRGERVSLLARVHARSRVRAPGFVAAMLTTASFVACSSELASKGDMGATDKSGAGATDAGASVPAPSPPTPSSPATSAPPPTTTPDAGGSVAVKWHPGYYGDCLTDTGAIFIALGNAHYDSIKSCIDFYATQANIKGVFILADWTSFEGDTPGCYGASCGNHLGAVATIGHPLWDDLFAYATSKGLKVIVGVEWFNEGTPSCTYAFPAYLVQPSCFGGGGTDERGTYGLTLTPGGFLWARIWQQASMDRFLAMLQDFGTRYDGNAALEQVIVVERDSSFVGGEGLDGFTFAALSAQFARLAPSLRPYFAHTGLTANVNWLNGQNAATFLQAGAQASTYMGISAEDAIVWQSTDGENAYIGTGGSYGTHDYRAEVPFTVELSGTTQCTYYDSYAGHNGLGASENTSPQEYYDVYFKNGKTDLSGAYPLRPSYLILGRNIGNACPSVAHQQYGTLSSGGWYQFLQTHPLNTTAPRLYPSVDTK
jgi:hypothetical protein